MLRKFVGSCLAVRTSQLLVSILAVAMGASTVGAVGLTYVDGDPDGAFNVSPLEAFLTTNAADNFWGKRTDFGAGATIWESQAGEDSPEIVQTIVGLTPGSSYDVYAVYWSDNDENWPMQAGLASNTYTTYSWSGAIGTNGIAGSVKGVSAALVQWDPAGLPPAGPAAAGTQLFTTRITTPPTATANFGTDDPIVMLLAKAGTAMADGSGNIQVFMNDLPAPGGSKRAWFDGVAYRAAEATPLTVPTATLDRDTGALTITNPSSEARDIKAIRIESAATNASGSLNGPAWTSVSSTNPNWSSLADPSAALPTGTVPGATPYATNLVETGSTNITLAANGGMLTFGNVWNRSPFDNLVIQLTLADDTLAIISPNVTGTVRAIADLNGDAQIDLTDYQSLLANIHGSVSGLTRIEALRKGDITGDNLVNFLDFQAFRSAYDLAHGSGSFDRATQVPEPGSVALLLGIVGLICGFSRKQHRKMCVLLGVIFCVSSSTSSALAVNIMVDFDSTRTSGTATTGGSVFTQAGFTSWNVTDLPAAGDTRVLDGVTVNLRGGKSGTPGSFVGALQSRIRLTGSDPNGGGGPQNNMLADLVYNEQNVAAGVGTEINLDFTGLPVGTYLMYSWHQDLGVVAADNPYRVIVSDSNGANSTTVATGLPLSASATSYFFDVTNAAIGKRVTFREDSSSTTVNRVRLSGFSLQNAVELTLSINTINGQMQIKNEQGINIDMSYYEIRSAAGSLETATWTSFDDGEVGGGPQGDYNGNSSVDGADYVVWRKGGAPDSSVAGYNLWRSHFGESGSSGDPVGSGWDEVPNSNQNILSELNLESLKSFAPASTASLGAAFELGGVRDLEFYYASPTDGSLRRGIVKYVTSGSGSLLDGSGVPEPTTFALVTLALSLTLGARRGRSRNSGSPG